MWALGRGRCVGSASDEMGGRLGICTAFQTHLGFQGGKAVYEPREASAVMHVMIRIQADGARGRRQLGVACTKDRRREFI